jgi:hypothetical protein
MRELFIDLKLDACACASLAASVANLEVGATPFRPKKLVFKMCTVIKTSEVWGCVRKSL